MPSENPTLAQLTTLRVGGPIGQFVQAEFAEQLIDAVVSADRQDIPVLVIGGGSNILADDSGFSGLVVRDGRSLIAEVPGGDSGFVTVRVAAGTSWDYFVEYSVEHGLAGAEALSGIPGTVGAAPVQNIGAYGYEVADILASVRVLDRLTGTVAGLGQGELQLAYRQSNLKRSVVDQGIGGGRGWGPTGRWVVLEAEFRLRRDVLSSPVRYQELAQFLGINPDGQAPLGEVRAAVLELRRRKGMVLDSADHDTWSAGSFFMNPLLSDAVAKTLPGDAPRFPTGSGLVKTSAAWLIGNAGFGKGYRLSAQAPAGLSTKHVLAVTNLGGAGSQDLLRLGREVHRGVFEKYGVFMEPEPVIVGCRF